MMGNLVSFPLLCLLNKACFDIACDVFQGPGEHRVGIFNGDDCAFCGSREFFSFWEEVTSTFGLAVNREKSGFSAAWIELNSRSFSVPRMKLVSKPVLSFLRPDRYSPDELLPQVISGVSGMSVSTQLWVVNSLMRYEISLRDVSPASIPTHWARRLLKKAWYRAALQRGPATVKECGEKREFPVTVGQPPREAAYRAVSWLSTKMQQTHLSMVRGKKVLPYERRLVRLGSRAEIPCEPLVYKYRVQFRWTFVWPTELLSWVECFLPELLIPLSDSVHRLEMPDHPFLALSQSYVRGRRTRVYHLYSSMAQPLSLASFREPSNGVKLDCHFRPSCRGGGAPVSWIPTWK